MQFARVRAKHPARAVPFEDAAGIPEILLAFEHLAGVGALQFSIAKVSRGMRTAAEKALAATPAMRALYVLGGFRDQSSHLPTVRRYCPVETTWTAVAPMPAERSGHAVVVLGGRLLVAGGCNNWGDTLQTVASYHPVQDRWQALAPMLEQRNQLAAVALDGHMYLRETKERRGSSEHQKTEEGNTKRMQANKF